MDIQEMKQHEWVVSWSGGKDSTSTIIKMHELGIPIKEIIYVRMMFDDEIPATLPIMTKFVDKSIKVFEQWGYKVRVVKSIKTAMQLMTAKYQRSKNIEKNGKYYGITAFMRGHCIFTTIKQKTIEKCINDNDYQMIGYAVDEVERLHRLNENKQSILAELNIKEQECFEICKKYDLLSPLYDLRLSRDGCWFCPNANKQTRRIVKGAHPDLYKKIIKSIEMCNYDITNIIPRNNWLKDYYNPQLKLF